MIVVDASLLANILGDDGVEWDRARCELRPGAVTGPDLIDVETVSVLRKWWIAGTLSDVRFAAAIDGLEQVPMVRVPTLRLMRRAYELRANVAASDASYVALAELLDCELLTADGRLARAPGPRCPIRLLS